MTEYIKFKVAPAGGGINGMTAQRVGDGWLFYSEEGMCMSSIAGSNFQVEGEIPSVIESTINSGVDSDTFLKAMAIAQDPSLAKELLT